jgi:hypothetical protein
MSDRAGTTVQWSIGNVLQSVPVDRAARFIMPAAADVDIYFGTATSNEYLTVGHAVVEVQAVVRLVDGTLLPARKSLLLAKSSVAQSLDYENPEIAHISVDFGQSSLSVAAGSPVFIPGSDAPATIWLTADLTKRDHIAAYGYRWYAESSMADKDADIKSDPFSPKIEVALPKVGALTIYLIVEDRSEAVNDALYHGGVDFVSFTVAIGADNSDADTIFSDDEPTDEAVVEDDLPADIDTADDLETEDDLLTDSVESDQLLTD